MKISPEESNKMFEKAGIKKDVLYHALRRLGRRNLKPKLRKDWSDKNPTKNYCYVVTEFLIEHIAPAGSKPFCLKIPGYDANHWFAKWPDDEIVDLTAEQFDDYENIDYSKGKRQCMQKTKGLPSKRTQILKEIYETNSSRNTNDIKNMKTIDRFKGSIIGLACGDALGAPVEFRSPGTFPFISDMTSGGEFNVSPGQWTDDTSLALCLTESLINKGEFDPLDQIRNYSR